jgi:TonB family protein
VRFTVNEKGVPTDVTADNCPKIFQQSALEAAWKWRFYPYKDNGVAQSATFVLDILFKLK